MMEQYKGASVSKGRDVVAVVGRTGVGKSTIIALLTGWIMGLDKDKNLVVKGSNQRPGPPKIGTGVASETRSCQTYGASPDDPNTVDCPIFLDVPGGGDVAGQIGSDAYIDLLNFIAIQVAMKSCKSLKLMLALNDRVLGERDSAIEHCMATMSLLSGLLGGFDCAELDNHVVLMLTKVCAVC